MIGKEKIKAVADEIGPILSKCSEEGFSILNIIAYKGSAIFGHGGSSSELVEAILHMIKNDKIFNEIWEQVNLRLIEEEDELEKAKETPIPIIMLPNTLLN